MVKNVTSRQTSINTYRNIEFVFFLYHDAFAIAEGLTGNKKLQHGHSLNTHPGALVNFRPVTLPWTNSGLMQYLIGSAPPRRPPTAPNPRWNLLLPGFSSKVFSVLPYAFNTLCTPLTKASTALHPFTSPSHLWAKVTAQFTHFRVRLYTLWKAY